MKNRKLSHNYVIERMRGTGYRMTSDETDDGLAMKSTTFKRNNLELIIHYDYYSSIVKSINVDKPPSLGSHYLIATTTHGIYEYENCVEMSIDELFDYIISCKTTEELEMRIEMHGMKQALELL